MQQTEPLNTDRLALVPLAEADVSEMVELLLDGRLYTYIGGETPSVDLIVSRYEHLAAGSPRPEEVWHNWLVRKDEGAVGFVQATVSDDTSDLAWVTGVQWQQRGYATEAIRAVQQWLVELGHSSFSARIHPDNVASQRVAANLGLITTGEINDDGEMIWAGRPDEDR